jgi:hypothetical protein
LVEGRAAAQSAFEDVVASADIRLREGLITQKEYNSELIRANESLAESMIDLGYNGLRGDIGDGVLNTAISQIKELTQANEDLETAQESVEDSVSVISDKISLVGEALNIAWDDAVEAEKEATIEAENLKNAWVDLASSIPTSVASVLTAIASLNNAETSTAIENIEAEEEAALDALEEELDAKIAALDEELLGEEAYEEAVSALKEEYADKEEELEDEYELKKAKREYKAAMVSWKLNLAAATAMAAQAILSGYSTQPFIPTGLAAGALATVLGGLQVAAVVAAKPVKSYATGTAGTYTVPEGFPNDSYTIGLTSGESYSVDTPNQQTKTEEITQTIYVAIDSSVLYSVINKGIANRKVIVK